MFVVFVVSVVTLFAPRIRMQDFFFCEFWVGVD